MMWSLQRPKSTLALASALGGLSMALAACAGGDQGPAMPRFPIAGTTAGGGGTTTGSAGAAGRMAGANAVAGSSAVSSGGRSGAGAAAGGGAGSSAGGSIGSAGSSGNGAPAGSMAAGGTGGAPPTMSSGCGATGAQTGQFQAQIMAADLMRGYFLSVPATYDANKPHRLVFGYHGSNYTGRMMRQYLDNEKAPLLANTIFVYPDGLPLPNQPSNIAWVLTDGGRDLVFFDTLLADLKSKYCIDEERIFVNGQSYGGLMTNAVGCLRGDVVRAIAVVAGSGPRSTCKGQVAAWLTHGTEDMNVSFSSGEMSRDRWVAANHCMNMTEPGMPMQCMKYVGCDAGHPVIWCPHTNDGGHQHPSFGRAAVREFLGSF